MIIVAENQTGSPLTVVNVPVPASGSATLTDFATINEIQDDVPLKDAINADQILLRLDGVLLTKQQSLNAATTVISVEEPTEPDHTVRVSANDAVSGRLLDKLVGKGVSLFEANDGGDEDLEVRLESKTSVTISNPTDSEDVSLFFTDRQVTIQKIATVVRGGAPAVAWNVYFASDRSAGGTKVFSSDQVSSNQTTGDVFSAFTNGTIPANSWVWLQTSAVSDALEFHLTVDFQG